MKFYVLLTVATVVIVSSYFYMKHQEVRKQIAAAEAVKQKRLSEAQARMEQAARLAEQEDAALAASGNAGLGAGGLNLPDRDGSGFKLNGTKRVKVVFSGKGPTKLAVRKTYEHMDDSYIGSDDDEDGFKYSSAKYSHPKERAERLGTQSAMSDDLLIVEGRLEERVQRARQ